MTVEVAVALGASAVTLSGSLIVGGVWGGRLLSKVNALKERCDRLESDIAKKQTKEVCGLHERNSSEAIAEIKQEQHDGRQEFRRLARNITKLAAAIQNGVNLDQRS